MRVTMEDTKKASILLIRKLFLLMQNLDSLPDDVSLTMKLYYYDDGEETRAECDVPRCATNSVPYFTVTPQDYEPPGFKEGVCDSLWFEGMAVHFRVGDLHTPFHVLKVGVAAEQGRVSKLQEGNHLRESVQGSPQEVRPHRQSAFYPQNEIQESRQCTEEDLPSDDGRFVLVPFLQYRLLSFRKLLNMCNR